MHSIILFTDEVNEAREKERREREGKRGEIHVFLKKGEK